MPVFPCQFFQPLHMSGNFTITPISIKDGIVELQIASCDGEQLMRAERFLQLLKEIWAQEKDQTDNSLADRQPLNPLGNGFGQDTLR